MITLNDSVFVQCPERGFNFRKIRHCMNCEYYDGLSQATVNGEPIESDDANDYQVICRRPITRKLMAVSED